MTPYNQRSKLLNNYLINFVGNTYARYEKKIITDSNLFKGEFMLDDLLIDFKLQFFHFYIFSCILGFDHIVHSNINENNEFELLFPILN